MHVKQKLFCEIDQRAHTYVLHIHRAHTRRKNSGAPVGRKTYRIRARGECQHEGFGSLRMRAAVLSGKKYTGIECPMKSIGGDRSTWSDHMHTEEWETRWSLT